MLTKSRLVKKACCNVAITCAFSTALSASVKPVTKDCEVVATVEATTLPSLREHSIGRALSSHCEMLALSTPSSC